MGKGSGNEADSDIFMGKDCFLKILVVRKMDPLPEILKWTHSICENYPRSFMRDRSSCGRRLCTLIGKYVTSDICFAVLLNKLFVLALLNCLYILYGETGSIPL
jgi:hypothetical protein